MSTPQKPLAVSGLILAGGEGRRMGGADKGLQALNGKPLVATLIACLAPQVDELLISANRHLEDYQRFGYPVFPDAQFDAGPATGHADSDFFMGPLAGLLMGLTHARHDWLLCVPCDTPHLPPTLCAQLFAGLDEVPGAPVLVARCAGQPQPTVCLVRRQLRGHLYDFLARGERKFGLWQHQLGATYVDFADAQAFANANSLDDLTKISRT